MDSAVDSLFGHVPSSLDSKYRAYILITVISICLPFLLFFVTLRLYVRAWVPKSFGLDDGKIWCLET